MTIEHILFYYTLESSLVPRIERPSLVGLGPGISQRLQKRRHQISATYDRWTAVVAGARTRANAENVECSAH